eukprot:Tamp_05006.p1 GENE.Tamp_05006~~Tamp_05006.p1  ORF type:complete len:515 (+),score=88.09 Tamp_05006:90-1547(+)
MELHAGLLDKKTRSLFAGWQARFCVLVGVRGAPSVTLRYFDSERAYEKAPERARGEIYMRVQPGEVLAKKIGGSVPTMRLQLPGRKWEFRSKEERHIDEWVAAFKSLADSRAEHVEQAAARAARDSVPQQPPPPPPAVGTKNPTLLPTGNPKTPRERTALTSTTSVDLERDRGDSPPVERLASPSTAPASRPFPTTPVGSPPPNTNGLHVTRPTTPPQTPPQAPPQQAPPQASVDPPVLIATTPRASEPKVHTPRESVPVPSSARGPLTPAPPPRQVGGGMTTPRNYTLATPRASSTISDGVPLSPRVRAPPVPMLHVELMNSREPKQAQEIQTMDGTIYFRAATRVSPRNYKSFTARKFLQPDVSSDEEGGDGDEESDRDGALLTDDDLLDLFMKKQKRMEQEAKQVGTPGANSRTQTVNGGGGDVPVATTPRPNAALQSMVSPRGGVQAADAVRADHQLSAQARALLSPRLPEGRNDIYTQRY